MNGKIDLFISDVIHEACVDVNEVGTEAVAATAEFWYAMCIPPKFIADRPFVFYIKDLES